MKPTTIPRRGMPLHALIQAAGVHSIAEAMLVVQSGIPCIGLPLRLPVHREDLSEAEAVEVCRMLDALPQEKGGPACPVCITYLHDAATIRDFVMQLGVSHVQLHGNISTAELAALRAEIPSLYIIKSLVIKKDSSGQDNRGQLLKIIRDTAAIVDAYITDTHDPSTGADGATGKTHDWSISRMLVNESPLPVILAGGLTPDNVHEAIMQVRPAGVDAHTGLENAEGMKDATLCRRFVSEALVAFAELSRWPQA